MAKSSRKKLIVAGCSMAHGAELDSPYMSKRNIDLSWSRQIADHLDCDLLNVALCACSNNWIFHTAMDNAIRHKHDIHSMIVMWTWPTRLTWKCDDSIYHLQPSFFCAHVDPYNHKNIQFADAPPGTTIQAESQAHANELGTMYPYMIRNMIDDKQLAQNQIRYSQALQGYCDSQGIVLYQTHPDKYSDVGTWRRETRHPNLEETKLIGKRILSEFYA